MPMGIAALWMIPGAMISSGGLLAAAAKAWSGSCRRASPQRGAPAGPLSVMP